MSRHAVILAAGDAKRLMPLTANRPTAMLLLGGKPLIQHTVEALVAHGRTDVVVVVGRHGNRIQSFLGDGTDFGAKVSYVDQSVPDGSAAALRLALPLQGNVWVLPGNTWITSQTLDGLEGPGDRLLVRDAESRHRHGVPSVRGDRLAGMVIETPSPGTRVSTLILQATPALLEALEGPLAGEEFLDEALGAYAQDATVTVALATGPADQVIDAWDLLQVNEGVLDSRGEATVSIGKGTAMGDPVTLGPYVSIRNNSMVGAHSEIRRSIINNNVIIESHALLRGCIVDDGARIGPGFICAEDSTPGGLRGCIIGEDAIIGAACRAEAGAVVQPGAQIEAGSVIHADGSVTAHLGDALRAREFA